MKENEIRRYAKLMEELGLTALEITDEGRAVRLERTTAPPAASVTVPIPASTAGGAREGDGLITVRSSMVGVFYATPAENAKPFVSVGDRVKKGQTLCIIEAMKLMNELCAEEEGEIAQICVKNGQTVEYGTELFKLRR